MKNLINTDFISKQERLKNLGCRPVNLINQYEQPFRELNRKKQLVKGVIIAEQAKAQRN